jgi:hypothetical protein
LLIADAGAVDLVSADLAALPPTIIITAGIDPLRSDGEKLAEKRLCRDKVDGAKNSSILRIPYVIRE